MYSLTFKDPIEKIDKTILLKMSDEQKNIFDALKNSF